MKRKQFISIIVILLLTLSCFTTVFALAYKYGDANGDGTVNLKDVTVLKRMLSGGDVDLTEVEGNPDADGSGTVNLKDVTLLHRYLAGGWGVELPEFPTEEEPDQDISLDDDLSQYEILSTKKSPQGIISTSFRYGKSVLNRDLVCWSIQEEDYSRTILLNFEIHGWEDSYEKDGQILVDLGNALVEYYSACTDLQDCRLLIIPSANPDGLAEGITKDGFGRCNADGVDLNRDFDANHQVNTNPRNYTPYPFSAPESRALRDLVLAANPCVVVDFHGWLNYTIGNPDLAEVFSIYTGLSHSKELTTSARGYFSYWAQLQGAEAILVEFKDPNSVDHSNVMNAVNCIMSGKYGSNYAEYELDERFTEFNSINSYALTGDRVYTQAAVGASGTSYGYIDGANDFCEIRQIYENGWMKVEYPVSGGTKIGYCKLESFIDPDTEVKHYKAYSADTVKVYTTSDLSTKLGSVWSTDVVTVVAEMDGKLQIIYPLDEGGYNMGWVDKTGFNAY